MAKYEYTVQGVDYEVEILEVEGTLAKVTVNGKQPISVGKTIAKPIAPKPQAAKVEGEAPKAAEETKPVVQAGEGEKVCAPLPGTITAIPVKVGDAVAVGDTVCILEAMKMQNNIEAETAGTITSIMVKEGDSVMEGTVLVTIA